jgi:hypothetical protein
MLSLFEIVNSGSFYEEKCCYGIPPGERLYVLQTTVTGKN